MVDPDLTPRLQWVLWKNLLQAADGGSVSCSRRSSEVPCGVLFLEHLYSETSDFDVQMSLGWAHRKRRPQNIFCSPLTTRILVSQ